MRFVRLVRLRPAYDAVVCASSHGTLCMHAVPSGCKNARRHTCPRETPSARKYLIMLRCCCEKGSCKHNAPPLSAGMAHIRGLSPKLVNH